jgi:hypothetical protein
MLGNLKRKLSRFFVRVRETPLPNLSATDRNIVQAASIRKKATAKQIISITGIKRRTAYSRLGVLTARKILVNNGGVYNYVGPKKELKVTPIIGLLSVFGVICAYFLSDGAIAVFCLVNFAVSYLIEEGND